VNTHSNTEPQSTAKRRRKWWLYALIPLIVVAVPALVWYFADFSRYALSLPHDQNVTGVKAELYIDAKTTIKEFSVPVNRIPKVLAALRPAGRDWMPAKWVVAGHLKIDCNNGESYHVDLYYTHHRVGAFSVHRPEWERNPGLIVSNYFRGGSDQAIRQAIEAAYADHQTLQVKEKASE
jgi:hypothetical protein